MINLLITSIYDDNLKLCFHEQGKNRCTLNNFLKSLEYEVHVGKNICLEFHDHVRIFFFQNNLETS